MSAYSCLEAIQVLFSLFFESYSNKRDDLAVICAGYHCRIAENDSILLQLPYASQAS